MPEPAEIRRLAVEMLGRTLASSGGSGEYKIVARLLDDDEPIEAMALGRLRGAGMVGSMRLIVATRRRLVLTGKGMLSRREWTREIPWDAVLDVVVTPLTGLDIILADERVELTFAQPPRQVGAIRDLARSRLGAARTTDTSALLDLARRRLGRMRAGFTQDQVVVLSGALETDEEVLEVAYDDHGNTLVAVTARRIVLVSTPRVRVQAPVSCTYDELRSAELEGGVIVLTPRVGEPRRIGPLRPPGSAEVLVSLIWQHGRL